MEKVIHPQPQYSKGEEIFNGVSHIVGAACGLIFMVVTIIYSVLNYCGTGVVTSLVIYGVSMITLYTMSTIYHMLHQGKAKRVFRIFDHCTIFLLIAGTYTPFIMLCLNNIEGYIILGIVWFCAIIGITFNAINMYWKTVKILSYVLYVAMGWCIIVALPTLISNISLEALIFLVLGGVFYTIGMVFFAGGTKHKWWHPIWHIFTLIGSILHFVSLMLLIL